MAENVHHHNNNNSNNFGTVISSMTQSQNSHGQGVCGSDHSASEDPPTFQTHSSDDGIVAEDSQEESSESSPDESDDDESDYFLRFSELTQEFAKPFQNSTLRRLRYTCCDISPNVTPLIESPARFAALGTTAGSVYLFELFQNEANFTAEHRSTLIYEDLIGSVSALQFAPVQLFLDSVNREVAVSNTTKASSGESELSGNSGCSEERFSSSQSKTTTSSARAASSTTTTTTSNNLRNVFLAIGSSKGDLLVIEFDPRFVPQNQTQQSTFKYKKNVTKTKKQWNVVYKSHSFTKNPIALLRWDNSERLFIADNCGQLFILHDVLEYQQMLILSAPTLLINLNGPRFQQIDVAEKLLIFSTEEQRVYLLNLDSSTLGQVGKQQRKSKKPVDTILSSGVCVLANYRLVELSNYFDDEFAASGRTSSSGGQSSTTTTATRAFRLVNTECQLFATRPKCRLWLVKHSGEVQFTHQFMELVQSTQTSSLEGDSHSIFEPPTSTPSGTIGFSNLYPMYWRNFYESELTISSFVVTWIPHSPGCNSILIIDPNEQTIVATSPPLRGQIVELKCVGNGIYIFYRVQDDETNTLLRVAFLNLCIRPPEKVAIESLTESLSSSLSLFSDSSDQDEELQSAEIHPDLAFAYSLFEREFKRDSSRTTVCQCNLPLAKSVSLNEMNYVISRSRMFDDLGTNVVDFLLRIAFQHAHWPLVLLLLIKIGAVRFYLLLVTLIDQDFLFERLYFGDERQRELLWESVGDQLVAILFNDVSRSNAFRISDFESTLNRTIEFYCDETATTTATTYLDCVSTPIDSTCELCRLKTASSSTPELNCNPSVSWLEKNFLSRSLSFCSAEFVLATAQQLITKLSTQTNSNSFSLSTKFFLLLYRFRLMQLSIQPATKQIIDQFSAKLTL